MVASGRAEGGLGSNHQSVQSFLVGQVKVLWDQIAVIVVHVVKTAERSVLKWLKW